MDPSDHGSGIAPDGSAEGNRDRTAAEPVRIIVLTHPAAPVPARLMQALQRRGTRVQLVTDVPMVMAELAGAVRPILIVNQSQRFANLRPLLASIDRYYPEADCWQFDEHEASSHRPRFSRLRTPASPMAQVPADADGHAEAETVAASDAASAQPSADQPPAAESPQEPPSLKIAAPQDLADIPEEEEEIHTLLTAEELAMLLGPADRQDAKATR